MTCIVFLVVGCSGKQGAIQRIALLAPFEGRYREIGYDAYYAVQLAIAERDTERIELLAIDDGGSENSAVERAKALASDPLIKAAVVLGTNATQPRVQQAFGQTPILIVGQWNTEPTTEHSYMLASSQIAALLSSIEQAEAPIVGGELLALQQVAMLGNDLSGITVVSSASLPTEDFRQHYLGSGQFVPEPGLLATLTYDAANMALGALQTDDTNHAIATMTYTGLNGSIRFVDGYWSDAPINYFAYDSNGVLTTVDRSIK